MSDRVTYCDVCECAECPKYGDDCDGDKRNDDLISRADAIDAVRKIVPVETDIDSTLLDKAEVIVELSALPSAEAEPSLKAIKRQIDEHWYLDPPSAEAVTFEDAMQIRNLILFKEYLRGRRDAVQVVLCKDCKHWASAEDYDCEIHSGAFGAEDFCSYGERKGGEDE